MNNSTLKTIAIITMLIDHAGAVLFPQFFVLRMIGRLAFPIFAFLLIEGFRHTSDQKKYLVRLGAFALISEIPFDLAFFQSPIYMGYQNIFFTLFLGFMMMMMLDKASKMAISPISKAGFSVIIYLIIAMVSESFHTDYGMIGITMILFFYIFKDKKVAALISVGLLHIAIGLTSAGFPGQINIANAVQALAALSMIFIAFYNGKKGWSLKYFFYLFYPVHLLILAGISQLGIL